MSAEHDTNCGIDPLRLGQDIGCTCYVRWETFTDEDGEVGVRANAEPPRLSHMDYGLAVEAGFLDAYLNVDGVRDEQDASGLLREDIAAYNELVDRVKR